MNSNNNEQQQATVAQTTAKGKATPAKPKQSEAKVNNPCS